MEEWNSDAFWKRPPELPLGLTLTREHVIWASPRPGPGGQDAFEEVTLGTPSGRVGLLAAYKAPLLVRDVPQLRKRLQAAIVERGLTVDARPRIPAIFTDHAQPAVRDVCQREWMGLVDQGGTIFLYEGPAYIHVEGRQRVKRTARANPFQSKGARVIRCLLESPGTPLQARQISARVRMSFSYCFKVLLWLEDEGYVDRRSPRTGFRLKRPVDLLRAWQNSGYRAAASLEAYYAPSTGPRDLDRVAQRLEHERTPFAFTLLSAIPDAEIIVGGLPHGLYLAGDMRPVVEELKLRKVTPYNFLVLRPEANAATDHHGVFRTRERNVSRPQLILDLAAHGGARGREQADHLLDAWGRELPLPAEPE